LKRQPDNSDAVAANFGQNFLLQSSTHASLTLNHLQNTRDLQLRRLKTPTCSTDQVRKPSNSQLGKPGATNLCVGPHGKNLEQLATNRAEREQNNQHQNESEQKKN
jgi:hypothetical protein